MAIGQGRDRLGKFLPKKKGEAPPGSEFEDRVCTLVEKNFLFVARQVHIKRYTTRVGFPGQPKPSGLVLADPRAKVDCVATRSLNPKTGKGLILYEAKESGPPNFTNPGLTASQKVVYPSLEKYGGEIIVWAKPFCVTYPIPKGTKVKIITPRNVQNLPRR